MKETKYMVKYRSHGKWIGPYFGVNSWYKIEQVTYPNINLAKMDEKYVKSATKCATKIVRVMV